MPEDPLITNTYSHVIADAQYTFGRSRDPKKQSHDDLEGVRAPVFCEEQDAHDYNTSLL